MLNTSQTHSSDDEEDCLSVSTACTVHDRRNVIDIVVEQSELSTTSVVHDRRHSLFSRSSRNSLIDEGIEQSELILQKYALESDLLFQATLRIRNLLKERLPNIYENSRKV